MKKVYLAGGISDTDRKLAQKKTAQKIREMGFEVYSASENDSINDKSNNPTPRDIYKADIDRVKEVDLFIVRISGGNEDGTLSEIGMVSGWNEMDKELSYGVPIKIIAYTTNERMMTPQFWHGIASGGINHLVAGMIDTWGVFVGGEEEMFKYIEEEI